MHWPQSALVLRTPRLELRPDDDAGLAELVDVAYRGVHPPDRMPFLQPWTDADPRYLGRGALQYFWGERARFAPSSWALHFLVRVDGAVVGVQTLRADEFGVCREVASGSWLGLAAQGRGIGTEMRAAVLRYAFDLLGARHARSEAFSDNAASLRVSEKLGYVPDGFEIHSPRGEPARNLRLRLTPATFRRPDWPLEVEGHTAELAGLLGAG
ncbi:MULTISPECIES: GNAT family N-acetyltransferase [Pseudonocardia]|uniref:Protein N-acetyltransferase, RimJ/RimL family n=1 Tax=Pseudonocardia oroxyli TaxID=366584 RepID=A0A1G7M841_PSEOR|nr:MULTISPECIES: GNAT family protein [Pseudonocardia]MCF7551816.1 GNAT family N-acetyltransferase [Pseudonocardia sp. WMMC193]SDF57892.1 Protein N-acetyltransferase, RimJ/RimL family [Pseudonocardia oroxyli]